MGREATGHCRWGAVHADVKALLETNAIVLRGDIKRRVPITALSQPRAEGDHLHFSVEGEDVELTLGAREAALWLRKIITPPPSLAARLGVGPAARALVIGEVTDGPLAQALEGVRAMRSVEARQVVAVALDGAALDAALSRHADEAPALPIWVVHAKGRGVAFGEGAVRAVMRGAGFIDTKVAAVSDALSATRYTRRT